MGRRHPSVRLYRHFCQPRLPVRPANIPTPDATVPTGGSVEPVTFTPARRSRLTWAPAPSATIPLRPPATPRQRARVPPTPSRSCPPRPPPRSRPSAPTRWQGRQSLDHCEEEPPDRRRAGQGQQPAVGPRCSRARSSSSRASPWSRPAGRRRGQAARSRHAHPGHARRHRGQARERRGREHTVAVGESLGIIARKYQVPIGELAAANNITDPPRSAPASS